MPDAAKDANFAPQNGHTAARHHHPVPFRQHTPFHEIAIPCREYSPPHVIINCSRYYFPRPVPQSPIQEPLTCQPDLTATKQAFNCWDCRPKTTNPDSGPELPSKCWSRSSSKSCGGEDAHPSNCTPVVSRPTPKEFAKSFRCWPCWNEHGWIGNPGPFAAICPAASPLPGWGISNCCRKLDAAEWGCLLCKGSDQRPSRGPQNSALAGCGRPRVGGQV